MLWAVFRRKPPSPVVGPSRGAPCRGAHFVVSKRCLFLRTSRWRACNCHFFLWKRSQTSHSSWDGQRDRPEAHAVKWKHPSIDLAYVASKCPLRTGHLSNLKGQDPVSGPVLLNRPCREAPWAYLGSLLPLPIRHTRLPGFLPGWFQGPEAAPGFPAKAQLAPGPVTPPGSPRGHASS